MDEHQATYNLLLRTLQINEFKRLDLGGQTATLIEAESLVESPHLSENSKRQLIGLVIILGVYSDSFDATVQTQISKFWSYNK